MCYITSWKTLAGLRTQGFLKCGSLVSADTQGLLISCGGPGVHDANCERANRKKTNCKNLIILITPLILPVKFDANLNQSLPQGFYVQ